MRRSSFPPELQKFVDTIEENARAAGHSTALARIFGAWSACFVRFCTVRDLTWRDPEHVVPFLDYLNARTDVDEASRDHAAKSMAFLFEELLKMDVSEASWHPDQASETVKEDAPSEPEPEETEEKGEQSTLLTRLLFHTSLPINEALELCAGDLDLDAGLIYVSDPMGTPKRIIELPDTLLDPLRRHLQSLRKKHGRRFFDAPLFQARALQGRVSEQDEASEESPDDPEGDTASAPADAPEESSDRPASLWGYAQDA